jgi:deazaflavin-dependent oxidoreductase (nitroreductase family)
MAWLYARIQQRLDGVVYAVTGGRATFSSWAADLPLLMLTTTGARTGRRRSLPVLGILDGDRVVVIASNYGRPRDPAWYHNLRAEPRASVAIGGVTREVRARELTGEEAERYFQRGVEMYPGFVHYRRWAGSRRIKVVSLDPAPRAEGDIR